MRLNKAFHITTVLLGLFPILKLNHFSILMMIWFVLAIILAIKEHTFGNFKKNISVFFILSFFGWMYLVYFPFSDDLKEITKAIVKSLPFIVFPLGLLLNKSLLSEKVLQNFSVVYIVSVIVLNCLGWFSVLNYGFLKAWQENDFYHPMFRTLFSNATRLHLPYLGLLSIFAALWLVYKMMLSKKVNIFSIISIFFLLFSVYIYSARMALGCFLIGFLFICWKFLKNTMIKKSTIVILPLLFVSVFYFSPLKERYFQNIKTEWVLPSKHQLPHEVNYRYGIWHCATKIIKNNWLWGVGADNTQKKLNKCYNSFEYQSYEDFSKVVYNSHNQYFDQLLKFGIFGLLLFCFFLVYFVPKADPFYQTFIIIVALSFLTENLLDRQIGVVFVSLLNSIFVVYKLQCFEKSTNS